jgi:bile acid:Na+ symporter, BASS family
MLRAKDYLLLFVVYASILAAVLFPRLGSVFQPYPQHFLMALFFLSFLTVRLDEIGILLKRSPGAVALFTLFKLLLLPVAVYFLFLLIAPAYAVSALLLAAVSTGVTAPFISSVVGGNSALVMVLVVVTSPLVPFTLPLLVEVLLGQTVEISFAGMIRMLATVILVPIASVELLRRWAPRTLLPLIRWNYPISLLLFALINLGVFSQYSDFFRREPALLLEATGVATLLAALFVVPGGFLFRKGPVEDRIAGAVAAGNINNVLVIVFASRFFSPLEPTVAALYLIPYFAVIVPLRIYGTRARKAAGSPPDASPRGIP